MQFLLFLTILLLSGCSTLEQIFDQPAQKLSPKVYYSNDLCIEYYGNKKCGTAVFPEMGRVKLRILSESRVHFFTLTTCHREIGRYMDGKRRFKIETDVTFEKGRACPMYLSSYNKAGKHQTAIIAFEDKSFTLPAKLLCNGKSITTKGTSICQNRSGLLSEISFGEKVKAVEPVNGSGGRTDKCPKLPTKDDQTFLFKTPARECIYGFIGTESKRVHLFYSVGYEEMIIRE